MRCKYCNNILTDAEIKTKDVNTGEYADECVSCYLDTLEDLCILDGSIEGGYEK